MPFLKPSEVTTLLEELHVRPLSREGEPTAPPPATPALLQGVHGIPRGHAARTFFIFLDNG